MLYSFFKYWNIWNEFVPCLQTLLSLGNTVLNLLLKSCWRFFNKNEEFHHFELQTPPWQSMKAPRFQCPPESDLQEILSFWKGFLVYVELCLILGGWVQLTQELWRLTDSPCCPEAAALCLFVNLLAGSLGCSKYRKAFPSVSDGQGSQATHYHCKI